jgi:hypothetical protein
MEISLWDVPAQSARAYFFQRISTPVAEFEEIPERRYTESKMNPVP